LQDVTAAPFSDLADRLASGTPLDPDDARRLAASQDLPSLGMLADEARRRGSGDVVTFVRVAVVGAGSVGAAPPAPSAGELRIAGRPASLASAVSDVTQAVRLAGSLPVTGFALEDIAEISASEGTPLDRALASLEDAGLAAVAWAALDRLADADAGFDALDRAGLVVSQVVLEAPVEGDRIDLLVRVRGLAARHAALRAFAPLPRTAPADAPTTGYDDLKLVALSRLLLGPGAAIQVDWERHGPKLAQVALLFGANDVDGVSPADEGGRRAPLEEIRRNIRAAGLTPAERDALGRPRAHDADTPRRG
jgi:aminodeoxyfutalosine synthase